MDQIRLNAILLLSILVCVCTNVAAQQDSTVASLQRIPVKYVKEVDKKIDKYSNRINNKTEKTLTKLSRWENKLKPIIEKANPDVANKLFGEGKMTFTSLLQKLKEGQAVTANYKAKYDEYRDKLTNNLKYLEQQRQNINAKLVEPVMKTNEKLKELDEDEKQQQFVQAFIKERKKELFDEATKYIGKSKYLAKINKESYYYVESIKNYKAIFNDPKKAEETALNILNKIPAFAQFLQKNSILASLFGSPSGATSPAAIAGLQTRSSVNAMVQNQIAMGGPNAQQYMQQNMAAAQAELTKLKDKILKAGGNSSDADMPNFKPDQTKTKTFKQRLEFGSNIQIIRHNNVLPATADLGFSLGYKINNKAAAGFGLSYKAGLGSFQHISITHQGVGLRSYADWKLKKQIFVSGGYEMNYNAAFKNIQQLQSYNDWQPSGLIGLTKKMNIKTKWTKQTKLQLLYDLLAKQHLPTTQPLIFRVGYNF